jgi:hypothetical protein
MSAPRRRDRSGPRRQRKQHAPVTVADLRDALAGFAADVDTPAGIDGTRHVYVRVGGPDGRLYPLVGVSTSTHLGRGIVILDGADLPTVEDGGVS